MNLIPVPEASKRLAWLRDNGTSLSSIAKETGLSYSWLYQFAQGKIENPTIGSLERLSAHPAIRDFENT